MRNHALKSSLDLCYSGTVLKTFHLVHNMLVIIIILYDVFQRHTTSLKSNKQPHNSQIFQQTQQQKEEY